MKNYKVINSSGIFKTIHHDGSYILLFGEKKIQCFDVSFV